MQGLVPAVEVSVTVVAFDMAELPWQLGTYVLSTGKNDEAKLATLGRLRQLEEIYSEKRREKTRR